MSNCKSLSERIRKAKNVERVRHLEKVAKTLYDLGLLTVREFQRLDILAVDRHITMEAPHA